MATEFLITGIVEFLIKRMKFPLIIPCNFPRITFYVYDMQSFGSAEAIGECVMSLKKVMKKLRDEGRYELLP